MSNFEYMIRLEEARKRLGHKPMWVYYSFLLEHPQDILEEDFKHMSDLLGYKRGWGHIKSKEWKNDRVKIMKDRDEYRGIKSRDARYYASKDLQVNKEF